VVCLPGDADAAKAAITATMTLDEPVDLTILPDIEMHSVNWQVLSTGLPPPCIVRVENQYQTPFFSVKDGWEVYLRSRSVNLRKSIRQSIKRCEGRGQVTSEVFVAGLNLQEGLDRLRTLDERTWQGKNGTGVFRSRDWGRFYEKLSRTSLPLVRYELEFLQIDGVDVAFSLSASMDEEVFLLRTGYDKNYENCHPGATLHERIFKRLAEEGMTTFDFGEGVTAYKKRWETGRHEHASYWVINRGTLKGILLWLELLLHDRIRPWRERWRSAKAAGPRGAEG
jgi:CelD/BcsL family acetyltransferase involved in cellulose biosynthesis